MERRIHPEEKGNRRPGREARGVFLDAKNVCAAVLSRCFGLLTVLVLLCMTAAFALAEAADPLVIGIYWTDPLTGETFEYSAQPYGDAQDAYWVTLPQEAFSGTVNLHLFDYSGQTAAFLPGDGDPLDSLQDAGSGSPDSPFVEISRLNPEGSVFSSVRLYLSSSPAPDGNVKRPDAVVQVLYRDSVTGMELYQGQILNCSPSSLVPVYAQSIPGYRVEGDEVRYIVTDEEGHADPEKVIFTYLPVQPARVTVRYLNAQTGEEVRESKQLDCDVGSTVVFYAEPVSGFEPVEPLEQRVSVAMDGTPDATEVLFRYLPLQRAQILVRCLNAQTLAPLAEDSSVECAPDSQVRIEAPAVPGYRVQGESSLTVTSDAQGTPDRTEVIFLYTPVTDPIVTVRYVSSSVLQQELSPAETVACPIGQTTTIRAKQIDGYVLEGAEEYEVTPGSDGELETEMLVFHYSAVPNPMVLIRCVLEDGTELSEPDQIACPVSQTTMISANTIAGYAVTGESVRAVTVDVNGQADTDEIVFVYRKIGDAVITVRYIDAQSNLEIRPSTQEICHLGANTAVNALGIDGYTIAGQAVKYVFVDEYGRADATEVVFTYEKAKAPGAVLVPVYYRDQATGMEFYSDHELFETDSVNYISADRTRFPEEYELVDPETQQVIVNSAGVPEPSEIIFWVRETARMEASIPVYYRSVSGEDVASPTVADCVPGNNLISAAPLDLKENYSLLEGDTQSVFMEADGTLSAQEVVFVYYLTVTPSPTPAPTPVPYPVEAQDFYAHPSKNGTYFRSSPTTLSMDNVLMELAAGEVVHVVGLLSNERGEFWYQVEAAGMEGFMNANVIQPMSQDEVNQVFGYTPTPVPTEIPDGATIDRWGQINSREVALRALPSTSGKVIDRPGKPAKIWVYQSVTEGDTAWYQVRYNGTDGYMMKKFITLMTETESLQYQSTLNTPMATRTPPATRMPTSEVTPSPTPGPTETVYVTFTPSPSPTAMPYSGYALTRGATSIYSSQTNSDDAVLSVEGAEQLILIQSQTYVDGTCWDSVEIVSSGRVGFALDSDLLHVNNEIARRYLSSAPTSGPTPVPTDVPAQYNGYGITIGEHAVIRAYADTNAQIYNVLNVGTVVVVTGQEYTEGQAWDIVNYGSQWGYIRDDQIRMLNSLEIEGYLATLRTPTPRPQATPTAVAFGGGSLSSYGYVTASRVNLRAEATQSSSSIRMLEQFAFALVLETRQNENGETWYHVSQAGTEGYIRSDYFKVMTLDELSEFLSGENYSLSGSNQGNAADASINNIQAFEDYNASVWKNPAISVSYAPFSAKTPEPEMTYLPTVSPTTGGTPSPTPLSTAGIGGWMNTASPYAAVTRTPDIPQPTPEPEKTGSGTLGVALIIGSAVFAGGGIYLYSIHRRNERKRREVREQQARKTARNGQFRQRTEDWERNRAQADLRDYVQEEPRYGGPEEGTQDFRAGAVPQGTIRVERETPVLGNGTRRYPPFGAGNGSEEGSMDATSEWKRPVSANNVQERQETAVFSAREGTRSQETVSYRKAVRENPMDVTRVGRTASTEFGTVRERSMANRTGDPNTEAAGIEAGAEAADAQTPTEDVPARSSAAEQPARRRRSDRHRADYGQDG